MRILIVSAHPAQVHGFRLVRDELLKAGHQVFWATTDKDIAINLLRQFGIEYFLILKAPKNFFGRVWYMLRNICRLIPYLRRNKIDLVVDRYEPFISVAAWLNRTPHICLADTEHAAIKCKPFIKMCQAALYPTCFYEHVTDDMLYFPGNIELFYLHPKRFTPKPVWDLLGIEPDTRFAIVRFVKWDAWHDTQLVGGFTLDQKRTLIQRLQAHMRVFISSESELPADLEPYRIHIPIEQMHHVQAAAALRRIRHHGLRIRLSRHSCYLHRPSRPWLHRRRSTGRVVVDVQTGEESFCFARIRAHLDQWRRRGVHR